MKRLVIRDTFGNPAEIEAEIGEAKVQGFILPSGAWSLYYQEGAVPALFIALRFKRKRKFRWVLRDNIISGLPGYPDLDHENRGEGE